MSPTWDFTLSLSLEFLSRSALIIYNVFVLGIYVYIHIDMISLSHRRSNFIMGLHTYVCIHYVLHMYTIRIYRVDKDSPFESIK